MELLRSVIGEHGRVMQLCGGRQRLQVAHLAGNSRRGVKKQPLGIQGRRVSAGGGQVDAASGEWEGWGVRTKGRCEVVHRHNQLW